MAASWKLVQAFIREATENADCTPLTEMSAGYARLRAVQRGAYTTVTSESGMVQLSSRIGETEFSFGVPTGIGPAEIVEVAERALALCEQCSSVAQLRAHLRPIRSQRLTYTGLGRS